MIDGGQLASQVVTGVAASKASQALDKAMKSGPSHEENIISLLTEIRDNLAPKEKQNIELAMALQPYPQEYNIDEDWYGKSHLCIFFTTSTPMRLDTEVAGIYQKTVGPGWVQVDMRGRLSTTDASAHNVKISYRDDALGVAI